MKSLALINIVVVIEPERGPPVRGLVGPDGEQPVEQYDACDAADRPADYQGRAPEAGFAACLEI